MSELAIGDVLTTVEQLDACPVDTVVMDKDRWRPVQKVADNTWWIMGAGMPRGTDELIGRSPELQVVWLPPPITEVTFETEVDDSMGWLDFDIPDDALPDSFEGRQVVVTVRLKEADDAE